MIFSSCSTGLLATNELPLTAEDNESSPPIKFTNPLAISEDAELETDEPTVIPSFKTPADLNDSKKLVLIIHREKFVVTIVTILDIAGESI